MNKLKTATTKLGNEIYLTGDETAKTLIIGVFHGDEPQGKFLIEKYIDCGQSNILHDTQSPLSLSLPLEGGGQICQYSKFTLEKSKKLRHNMTDAESLLWDCLRAKRLDGFKFRRQQPIGKYIVDFVCMSYKLVVELDGGQHNEIPNKVYDEKRTQYLNKLGYKVLRIWNDEIFSNLNGVLEYILSSLPPRGGGIGRGGDGKLFIPCLNPDGLQLGQRTNANGVDLNRNFPTKNWELTEKNEFFGGEKPASEIETQFLIDVINQYKPETILTLHAPFKVVNYDGPARELAEQISQIIGYPVEESIGYPTPGSFGTYAGIERQIKTITLELDETCHVEELLTPVHKIFDIIL